MRPELTGSTVYPGARAPAHIYCLFLGECFPECNGRRDRWRSENICAGGGGGLIPMLLGYVDTNRPLMLSSGPRRRGYAPAAVSVCSSCC